MKSLNTPGIFRNRLCGILIVSLLWMSAATHISASTNDVSILSQKELESTEGGVALETVVAICAIIVCVCHVVSTGCRLYMASKANKAEQKSGCKCTVEIVPITPITRDTQWDGEGSCCNDIEGDDAINYFQEWREVQCGN